MKKKIIFNIMSFIILIEIATPLIAAEAPNFSWAKQINGSQNNWDETYGLATDTYGNIIVSGYASGETLFDGITIPTGNFIVKCDGNGNAIWATRTSTTGYAMVHEIATDSFGNVFTTGYFNGTITFDQITLTSRGNDDVFITKYDTNGNLLWVEQAGGIGSDRCKGIAVDALGNIIVVGSCNDDAIFGSTTVSSIGFMAKYNPEGNLIWVKEMGWGSAEGITTDSGNNIVIVGGTSSPVFVVKYSDAGVLLWDGGTYEASYAEGGYCVVTDSLNKVYAMAWFSGTIEIGSYTFTESNGNCLILRYEADGSVLYPYQYDIGRKNNDIGKFLGMDTEDDWYRIGEGIQFGFSINNHVTEPGYTSYAPTYSKIVEGDHMVDYEWKAKNIVVDAADNVIVTGRFHGNVFFGETTLNTSNGDFDYDIFIAKLGNRQMLVTQVIGGHGSISPSNRAYDNNTTVSLIATPNADYRVKTWTGTNNDSTTNTVNTVTMNNNKLVTVEFELIIGDPDLNGDDEINFIDFANFANNWVSNNCDTPNWCENSDFNKDGYVDINDLVIFTNSWLE